MVAEGIQVSKDVPMCAYEGGASDEVVGRGQLLTGELLPPGQRMARLLALVAQLPEDRLPTLERFVLLLSSGRCLEEGQGLGKRQQ